MTKDGKTTDKKRWVWAPGRQWLIAGIAAAAVIIADQVSKLIVVACIDLYQWVNIIDPLLRITFAQNFQGMFSLSFGPGFLYVLLPIVAIGLVTFFLLQPQNKLVTVLMGLILGGGLGNLIDRIRLGYVVDWISMGFRNWRWATYNLADASIVVAVIILLIYELFFTRKEQDKEPSKKS